MLYDEVITSGLCTGCAGCVIACPHDVIGYLHEPGAYKPYHLEEELGPDDCIHGQKGCTSCTRACPRFRAWEPEADEHLFARVREPDEPSGIYQDILLTRASDDMVHQMGQDGGFVSALLIWALEHDYIDAALTSYLEGGTDGGPGSWKAIPGVASTKEEMTKMNIKGVFQIWMRDGSYHEINLKECHAWTRDGCHHCPDFAAEHADISTGGIGKYNDWTLTIVRTELGREIISRMIDDGSIEARPGDDDPAAIALMHKLSMKSRERWPEAAIEFPKNRTTPEKAASPA